MTALWALLSCAGGRPLEPMAAASRLEGGKEVVINERLVARPILGPDGRALPDVMVVTDTWYHDSNVLVVHMPDGTVVFCSSPFETQGALAMIGWVRQVYAPTKLVAINPHFHFDGTGGNAAYHQEGATIYGSDLTARLLAEKGEALRAGVLEGFTDEARRAPIEALQLVAPDQIFPAAEGLQLDFGGEQVQVVYPGPAHAPDNVVVYFPSRGILFGGCMIKVGDSLGYLGDADVERWDEAVHVLEALGAAIVVPGHGPVGDVGLLANTLRLVAAGSR